MDWDINDVYRDEPKELDNEKLRELERLTENVFTVDTTIPMENKPFLRPFLFLYVV